MFLQYYINRLVLLHSVDCPLCYSGFLHYNAEQGEWGGGSGGKEGVVMTKANWLD